MSHSEYTENYKLAKFIDNDQPTFLGDWNETMEDIDSAIKGVADKETTMGNTVSALILRVDSHDGKIATLETDVSGLKETTATHTKQISALESKTDDIQTALDGIENASATTAGIVKISDGYSGTATDTALSQKGAADLVASAIAGGLCTPKVLYSGTFSLVYGLVTKGEIYLEIIDNPLTKQLVFTGTTTSGGGIVTSGGGGVDIPMPYTLPEAYRPSRTKSVLFAVSTNPSATTDTSIVISDDGTLAFDMWFNAEVDNHGFNGNAIVQYGV